LSSSTAITATLPGQLPSAVVNESSSGESASVQPREFTAADGAVLVGDLAVPVTPRMAAIICHPHPQYGGNRFDNVVTALFEALPRAGIAALRFDFRDEFSGGAGERLDALAAIDDVAAAVPGVPIVALGYSFGAIIALGLDDERVTALGLVAPPLAMTPDVAAPTVPTLVLVPAHDQFSPPAANEPIISDWRSRSSAPVDLRVVEMADHFLAGRTAHVAESATTWILDHLTR
jgi:alpha/beta superfamily hydrolase